MAFDFKATFFDSAKVKNLVDKKTRSALSKFGRFVRVAAKSSIRKRKKISEVGKPPSSHRGWLKDHIFFAWDPKTKSVVVGPEQLGRGTAPKALEHGGPSLAFRRFKAADGTWMTAIRTIKHIRPRPFMNPAMEQELPKFLPLFRG